MFPIINIGPLAIQAASFILLLSFFIGSFLTGKFSTNIGTHTEAIENGILIGLIAGILGARLGFMLKNPSIMTINPLSLFSLSPSMLDASFGILVGILTLIILAQRKHLPLWPTLDALTPFCLLIFMGIHLANFANGSAYGIPTQMPWGISLWNATRHPVQLYGFILGAVLTLALLIRTRWLKTTGFMHNGVLFSAAIAGIAVITLFTRAFNAEKFLLGQFDFYQLIAFGSLLCAMALLYVRAFPRKRKIGVIISMGSNIDPQSNFSQAEDLLADQFRIRRKSGAYLTEDVHRRPEVNPFHNKVLEIETNLPYPVLDARLKAIEKQLGRETGEKVQVALDLDILTYGDCVFKAAHHHIPSPDMLKYRYLAMPLAEMLPGFRHPATGVSIQEILEKITDQAKATRINEVENGIER
ncbi:MAG TPA: 2-amino-4-hydroxy-6-hydroxymethyldihydropteridine diphosphokinase [Brevefilum sp.]|nr:2-amino-4-hydroxy-6-hydroxymethyldihydropteridine diphosphokinase [Brevefilum sp.]HOR18887.1 2-amino-4-hydroxy-6-hydroxymethyldihydropteridine diphosphokinase [Brevefilum sp.]HPL70032.1 2-amino-4-hydroxy-6-hydroxymethyldihydropteridine diphosphokinase [Brevefilum sp.]